MLKIPLALSIQQNRNSLANREYLVNLFANAQPPSAKNTVALLSTPGIETIFEIPNNRALGLYATADNRLFIVMEDALYELINNLDGTFSYENRGGVDFTGELEVSMADNGKQLLIVAGDGYSYDLSANTIKKLSSSDNYYPSHSVTFQDGYFILVKDDTQQFYISDLYSDTFDATMFASKEGAPDKLLGVKSVHREVFLIGEHSMEIWYDSGNVDFPFERMMGTFIKRGTTNIYSIARLANTVTFVGDDDSVYVMNGYTPVRISNPTVEYEITKSDKNFVEAFSYAEEGHIFYVLTLDKNKTFVYDLTTRLWHKRQSRDIGRWRVKKIKHIWDMNIGIDAEWGKVYRVGLDYNTEDGTKIERIAILPTLHNNFEYFTVNRLALDIETGIIADRTQEPVIRLQYSDDDGKTWSNWKEAKLGKTGEYITRVIWDRLGRSRSKVFKIWIDIPMKIDIVNAFVEVS